jgi:hypothetical protein
LKPFLIISGGALNISPHSREVVDKAGNTITISCVISGLTAKVTTVEWKKGADKVNTLTDRTYTPNVGEDTYNDNDKTQTTTLEISGSDTPIAESQFTCVVTDPKDGNTDQETPNLKFYSKMKTSNCPYNSIIITLKFCWDIPLSTAIVVLTDLKLNHVR